MENIDTNVIELLEYLQDIIDNSPKVPMSSKAMIDKKEALEIIDQIINYLPDQFKKAQWIVNERDRILSDAKKEYDNVKKETSNMLRQNVENSLIVKEAKIRGEKIIASAQKDAKAIRIGSRDYSEELLSELDQQIINEKEKLIKNLQTQFQNMAEELDKTMNCAGVEIQNNIKELKDMKK
ncbi:ATPase [Clostridium sp. BJN0001]|uniref:ATPase n=1 Tax=Clostridium sp. BJN0001 TaxID=2930219 RepID=UPI001FD36659|nr:ATPase [Clostridium sp. BJN0001]